MLHVKFYFDKHASNKMNKDESWLYNQRKINFINNPYFHNIKESGARKVAHVVVSLHKLNFLERIHLINSCKFNLEFRINTQRSKECFSVPQFSYKSQNEIIKINYLNGVY